MVIDILLIVVGVAMVLFGADRLTEGASQLARRMRMSELVIGLTVVAFGTSMPEFVISLTSAFKGSTDLAVGNVVGSNIFNTLLIVGVSALVAPIAINKESIRRDCPFGLFASIVLLALCLDHFSPIIKGNTISRVDGIILLVLFVAFMFLTLKSSKNADSTEESETKKTLSLGYAIVYFIVGLGLLIWGSDIFVDAAVSIAQALNVSESVIGLTIVAFGTSLPELATSVVAAKKGKSEMAIGNVVGSNVFNILWILGATAVVCPLGINGITIIDLSMMIISMVMLWLFSYTKFKVERWEGLMLTMLFVAYMAFLIVNA
ncbi:MAG: calcium/sodium antiporter [Prevotellaceae bacterium]|nr:calcium/sodium antiporter [Prevotellaceae bacterium]